MKKFIPLLLSLVLLPSLAMAKGRQFDVEVLIFKRVVDAEKTQESWPETPPKIDMTGVEPFSNHAYRQKKGAQMLSYSHYKLLKERDKLKQHAGFEVLLHKAWRQGDNGRASAPKFHIQAGHDFSKEFHPDGTKIGSEKSGKALDGSSVVKPLYELDGKLQVYVQHYLFAETALNLREPSVKSVTFKEVKPDELKDSENFAVLADTSSNTVQSGNLEDVSPKKEVVTYLKDYRMQQKRRMRSGETHYLDNPLMGMIIQVRRVQN
ncbi:peptidoglycan binding protein CsiV [Vibrio gallicus]|uniref:peptidoglycan binding protein CsiV n=1 Tax=Vibrio gallicus TaxID=190897 RepID=UPI0021C3BCC4|nr:peptidoglycan binding protein CsiV [Vibrio gallicus]